jgi:hypothetical protein
VAPSGFRSAPAYSGNRYPGAYSGLSRGYSTGAYANRYAGRNPRQNSYSAPGSYVRRAYNPYRDNRDGNHRPPYRRPYRGGYGIAYGGGYTVWPSPYYLGDPYLYDNGYGGDYDDSADYSDPSVAPYPADQSGYGAEPYPAEQYPPAPQDPYAANPNYDPNAAPNGYAPNGAPGYGVPGYGQPGYGQPGYGSQPYSPESQPAYRPQYQPSPSAIRPVAPPASQVTLVYKDGRSEQIHNFLLSRDTITIWDQRQNENPREIPIDQLDIAATEKANRDAGVDFRLPALQ